MTPSRNPRRDGPLRTSTELHGTSEARFESSHPEGRSFDFDELLIADGANGLWAAANKAWPQTTQQRCWLHYADLLVTPMWSWATTDEL
jgi:hypothetical protein